MGLFPLKPCTKQRMQPSRFGCSLFYGSILAAVLVWVPIATRHLQADYRPITPYLTSMHLLPSTLFVVSPIRAKYKYAFIPTLPNAKQLLSILRHVPATEGYRGAADNPNTNPPGLPPRFRLPHVTPDTFYIPPDGSPMEPSDTPDYHSPYNIREYHQYDPWYSPYKWSDGRVYANTLGSRISPFGWSPPRPLRERDLAYPSVPFGWRVFSALAFDKPGWLWQELVRSPLHLRHLVWARLSTRLLRATAKMLCEYVLKDEETLLTTGNYFIFAAPTLHHAVQFMKSNPFVGAGLYKQLLIYEYQDKTCEHILLGRDSEENTQLYLVYGEDADTPASTAAKPTLRTILEDKHLRFLCRSNSVHKRALLRAPLLDTLQDLQRPVQQHLPILDKQIERLQAAYPSAAASIDKDRPPLAEVNIIHATTLEKAIEWANRDPFTRAKHYKSMFITRLQELDFYGKCSTLHTPTAGTVPFDSDTQETYVSERDDVEYLIQEVLNVTEDASRELDTAYYAEFLKDWVWVALPEGEYWAEDFAVSGERETGANAQVESTLYNAYAANREVENRREFRPGFWLYKPESKVLHNDTSTGALTFGTGVDGTFSWDKPVDPTTLTQAMIDMEIQKEETRRGRGVVWEKHWAPVTAQPNTQTHLETEEEERMKWGLPHWDLRPGTLTAEDYTPSGMDFLNRDKMERSHPDFQRLMQSPDVVHDIHSDFIDRLDRGEATLEDTPFRPTEEELKLEPEAAWFQVEKQPTLELWVEGTN